MNHKAFVSSTFLDLKDHRRHVIQKLRSAGITVDPMEDWVAADDAPKKLSLNRIKGCDLCVLLVAFRRGYIPEGEVKSITQLEYEYAAHNHIDVLVFLLKDKSPWPREYDDWEIDAGIQAWRNELKRKHTVSEFGLDPTSVEILEPVLRWYSEREDSHKMSWPKAVDMELVTQSFFESTFPAYILDASDCVIAWNSSFMVLVGQHDGPERGQHIEDWIKSKGHEMEVLSVAKDSSTSVERATLVLHTEKFGRMKFDQLTTPIIDRELGVAKYHAAALSPAETDREVVERFLEAVECRLADQLDWSQYAVAYDRVLMRYSGYNELIELHCGGVRNAPPGRVLDLGAGTGNVAFEILGRYPDCLLTAVDYNQPMLYLLQHRCRKFEERLEIRFADLEQLDDAIKPESVAVVIMNNILMLLKEPLKTLQRVCTWLMDNGILSIHVPNHSSSIDALLLDIRRELEKSGYFVEVSQDFSIVYSQNRKMGLGQKNFLRFSPEELTILLNEAGFTVDQLKNETYAGQGLYALATKRKTMARNR